VRSERHAPGSAGFFSSDKRLVLPLGTAAVPHAVRGYPLDFRIKAQSLRWPPDGLKSPSDRYVPLAQYGLGCYERYLMGEGEAWLAAALRVGRYLVQHQEPDGSWLNRLAFTHTFPLAAPWCCGMAQGEAASLLVRLHLETREARFAEAARDGLAPLWRSRQDRGVCAELNGHLWPEEYPTDPPSFVLNGAIFAWWGMRDVAVGLADERARQGFSAGIEALASNLDHFDAGYWSLYCLYRHPMQVVASSFYHTLHITQLEAMQALAPRPVFEETRKRWIRYRSARTLRWNAFARKVAFRLFVPRNRLLANGLRHSRRNQTRQRMSHE
jgi:heparosan-N-sulfate-glucuronate 5-epimerase